MYIYFFVAYKTYSNSLMNIKINIIFRFYFFIVLIYYIKSLNFNKYNKQK